MESHKEQSGNQIATAFPMNSFYKSLKNSPMVIWKVSLWFVSRSSLAKHREKKRWYSTVECGRLCKDGTYSFKNPIRMLQEMLVDNLIQIYPTKMSISNCSACEESEELE